MTNEEALRLAKLAWPTLRPLKTGTVDGWSVVIEMEKKQVLLCHEHRDRFEAALRVLAGNVETPEEAYQRGLDEAEDAVLMDYSNKSAIHRAFERLRNPPKAGEP